MEYNAILYKTLGDFVLQERKGKTENHIYVQFVALIIRFPGQ